MERFLQEQKVLLGKIKYLSILLLIVVLIPVSVAVFFMLKRNRLLRIEVSTRLEAEEENRKLEEQLAMSQRMDAIGKLAGGIAHDFNNILMIIQGNVSMVKRRMMADSPGNPDCGRLELIEQYVERGSNLTKQLLGFARQGKYELKNIAVNGIIRKSADFFTETRKEIEAELHLQEDVHSVEADPGQLEQVLLNIFINSGQAMPGGGRLIISSENVFLDSREAAVLGVNPGDYVRITISDTGIGMSRETLGRIFEPFFSTRAGQGGTGLGLASAYGIIRNHGGMINASSEPGSGSTFNIYLPSSGKSTGTYEEKRMDYPAVAGKGVILIVDDEKSILDVASEFLETLGYTVYTAENEHEAVSIYREKSAEIDLVILDMILRGMSGAQVLGDLREINPEVKVVLSSGYSLQGEVRKVMESGCLGFIQKPYNFTEMSDLLHKILHRA